MRKHALLGSFGLTLGLFALTANAIDITGAGATFPYPIYAKWAEAYKAKACAAKLANRAAKAASRRA